ncbi:MAG: hypothetical protein FWE16_05480, partial [Firmicutes bacterium]|nr:hypothetical protein [Bacillota bacterium]
SQLLSLMSGTQPRIGSAAQAAPPQQLAADPTHLASGWRRGIRMGIYGWVSKGQGTIQDKMNNLLRR